MAIQPDISLAVKPIEIANPADQMKSALAIRGMQQQQAAGAQQLQAGAIGLQEKQTQLQDQQQVRQAMADPANRDDKGRPDLKKVVAMTTGKISPDLTLSLTKHINDTQEQMGKLDEQDRAKLRFGLDRTADVLGYVQSLDPALRPAAYQSGTAQLQKDGVDTSSLRPDYDPDAAQASLYHAQGYIKLNDEARAAAKAKADAAEAANKAALAPTQQAEAEEKLSSTLKKGDAAALYQAAKQGPQQLAQVLQQLSETSPDRVQPFMGISAQTKPEDILKIGMEPHEIAADNERVATIAKLNTPAELAFKASDPNATPESRQAAKDALKILEQHAVASRPIIQNFAPGIPQNGNQQATGEDFLKTLGTGAASQVKAIAEGRATLPSASTRSQAAIQLRNAVFQYDPSYNDQRAQIRKNFTTGTDGRNIRNLNLGQNQK